VQDCRRAAPDAAVRAVQRFQTPKIFSQTSIPLPLKEGATDLITVAVVVARDLPAHMARLEPFAVLESGGLSLSPTIAPTMPLQIDRLSMDRLFSGASTMPGRTASSFAAARAIRRYRVEEDAIHPDFLHQVGEHVLVGFSFARGRDVPRIVIDEHPDPTAMRILDERAEADSPPGMSR